MALSSRPAVRHRATGQDDRLDADFCAELLAGMELIEEVMRSSGQYGRSGAAFADDLRTGLAWSFRIAVDPPDLGEARLRRDSR